MTYLRGCRRGGVSLRHHGRRLLNVGVVVLRQRAHHRLRARLAHRRHLRAGGGGGGGVDVVLADIGGHDGADLGDMAAQTAEGVEAVCKGNGGMRLIDGGKQEKLNGSAVGWAGLRTSSLGSWGNGPHS